jgi:hypothetical protein
MKKSFFMGLSLLLTPFGATRDIRAESAQQENLTNVTCDGTYSWLAGKLENTPLRTSGFSIDNPFDGPLFYGEDIPTNINDVSITGFMALAIAEMNMSAIALMAPTRAEALKAAKKAKEFTNMMTNKIGLMREQNVCAFERGVKAAWDAWGIGIKTRSFIYFPGGSPDPNAGESPESREAWEREHNALLAAAFWSKFTSPSLSGENKTGRFAILPWVKMVPMQRNNVTSELVDVRIWHFNNSDDE